MKLSAKTLSIAKLAVVSLLLLTTVNAQIVRIQRYGCAIVPDPATDAAEMDLKKVLVKTSDPYLDQAILGDMDALNRAFQVSVGVYYPNDSKQDIFFSTQAQVGEAIKRELLTRDDVSPDRNLTGFIFISKAFLQKEAQENYGSKMSVPGLLAHEYAHALQYRRGFLGSELKKELQADFMAGWYIAYRCTCIAPQDVNAVFRSFYNKGERSGQFRSRTHGTPEERFAAAVSGYKYFYQMSSRYQSVSQAADNAYDYSLRVINPQ